MNNTLQQLRDYCEKEGIYLTEEHNRLTIDPEALTFAGYSGQKIIVVEDECSDDAKAALIAHELGHWKLGHMELRSCNGKNGFRNESAEKEARVFAAVFTAMAFFFEHMKESATV